MPGTPAAPAPIVLASGTTFPALSRYMFAEALAGVFAVIQEVGFPIKEYGGKPAASKIACLRIRDGQGESYGDSGVDGISPGGKDLAAVSAP